MPTDVYVNDDFRAWVDGASILIIAALTRMVQEIDGDDA